MPLLQDERVIGVMSAVSFTRRTWTPGDIEFAEAVATHASIAIHNADLFGEAEVRAGQLAVLQAASARMSRQNTIESVGRAIVEEIRQIIDYHNGRVYMLEDSAELIPIAFEGTVGAYEQVDFEVLRTKLGEGFTGWVGAHGLPLLINDANDDPRGATIPGTDEVDESMLVVPMRYDERVIGVITLSKLGLNQFDENNLRLLTILADQAATAVESARLLTRSERLAEELRGLLDMSSALSESLDPRQVADLIARHLAVAMGVERCGISYWERTIRPDPVVGLLAGRGPRGGRAVLRPQRLSRDPPCARAPGDLGDRQPRPAGRSGRGGADGPAGRPAAGHAAAGGQGHLDRPGRADVELAQDVRRDPPGAGPDDGQRGGDGPRERPPVRGRPQAGRP